MGDTSNEEPIYDSDFNVSVANAVKLSRSVEMYQWVESSTTNNNVTTYNYRQEWRSSVIDSGMFHQPGGH
jgi:hypothetical protein